MPPLSDSNGWASFVDWHASGQLRAADVALAVAAILPIAEAKAESLVSKTFDRNHDGFISKGELQARVLPYLRKHVRSLVEKSHSRAPDICRGSTDQELLQWFDFWDTDRKGSIDVNRLKLAILGCFSKLGVIDAKLDEGVAVSFLEALGYQCGACGDR